jgi:hypothetical protein
LTTARCQGLLDSVTADPDRLRTSLAEVLALDAPLEALRAAQEVRELLPAWESHLARQALGAGETWESIGAALGISRQAAWERLRPGIVRQIQTEKSRIRTEQTRLKEERNRRWATKK